MIGKLSGLLDRIGSNDVILDVAGVGYKITCSSRTLRQLGAIGTAASLLIETHVREDSINLFGFATAEEQEWFNLLTTVQGVGAKVGLAILGSMSPSQLLAAIAAQDKAAMTEAEGVGPKLALRLVTELKDKVQHFAASGGAPSSLSRGDNSAALGNISGDALSALTHLGYRRAEAFSAVTAALQRHPAAKIDELIRLSLAELSRKDSAA